MNFREWLIVAGLIVFVGLITDAVRRIIFQRRFNNKLTFGLETVKVAESDYYSELPNGGARIKQKSVNDDIARQTIQEIQEEQTPVIKNTAPVLSVYEANNNQHRSVSAKMSSAHNDNFVQYSHLNEKETELQQKVMLEESGHFHIANSTDSCVENGNKQVLLRLSSAPEPIAVTSTVNISNKDSTTKQKGNPFCVIASENKVMNKTIPVESSACINEQTKSMQFCIMDDEQDDQPSKEQEKKMITTDEVNAACAENKTHNDAGVKENETNAENYLGTQSEQTLAMYLEPEEGKLFSGSDVLQVLLDNGLRMGKMNIFHYVRKGINQDRDTLFSVANGVEPGYFDLKQMSQEKFRALSFFITLPGPESPVEALKTMIKVIDTVSKYLYAEVKDDQHCTMTLQMLEYYRIKAVEYQRRKIPEQYQPPSFT